MLEHGNILITEKNDIKSLQKRSKKPTENSTRTKIITKKDGTTKIITKKKRKEKRDLDFLSCIDVLDISWQSVKRNLKKY